MKLSRKQTDLAQSALVRILDASGESSAKMQIFSPRLSTDRESQCDLLVPVPRQGAGWMGRTVECGVLDLGDSPLQVDDECLRVAPHRHGLVSTLVLLTARAEPGVVLV